MLQNYLKIALRNLLRNKVYSFINIFGLAIGVSACLVIFLLVSFELSFDNFHPNRDRIYRITSGFKNPDGSSYHNAGLSAPMPSVIRQELTGIESLSAFHNWSAKVTVPNPKNDKNNSPKTWKSSELEDLPIIICEPSKDFLKLVILGIAIASPIAYWAMNKWLQDFAYRVEISWWIFALAGIMAIIIALLTVSYQSIKAALANPVKSLRTE